MSDADLLLFAVGHLCIGFSAGFFVAWMQYKAGK
jgi:hypothetical protein